MDLCSDLILGSSIFSSGLRTFVRKHTSIINSVLSIIQAGIQFVRIKSKRQTAHPCSGAKRATSAYSGYFVHAKALSSNHSSQSCLLMSTGCFFLNSFIYSENLHCICKTLFFPLQFKIKHSAKSLFSTVFQRDTQHPS